MHDPQGTEQNCRKIGDTLQLASCTDSLSVYELEWQPTFSQSGLTQTKYTWGENIINAVLYEDVLYYRTGSHSQSVDNLDQSVICYSPYLLWK